MVTIPEYEDCSLVVHVRNKVGAGIAGIVYMDSTPYATDGSQNSTLVLTDSPRKFTLRVVPTNPAYQTFEIELNVPVLCPLPDITAVLLLVGDTTPIAQPWIVRAPCSNVVYAYNTANGNYSFIRWDFGDGYIVEGEAVIHNYSWAGNYAIIETVETCVGSVCTEDSETTAIEIPKSFPSSAFAFECGTLGSNVEVEAPCTSGCLGCNCDDQSSCRCVQVGQTVNLIPNIQSNLGDCPSTEYTITWYANDEQISTVTLEEGDSVEDLELVFDQAGSYTVKQVVSTCCGSCEFSQTIKVGPPLQLVRVGCGAFTFTDTVNYGEDTIRVRVDVEDASGRLVKQYLVEDYDQSTPPLVSIPSDGVFIVSFYVLDATGTILTASRFIVYEFCSASSCYRNMVERFLCDTADCRKQNEASNLSKRMDEFLILASALYASVDIQMGKTYGTLSYKAEYLAELVNQDLIIQRLVKVCADCPQPSTSSDPFQALSNNCSDC